jgi:hypothetical protein
VGRSSSASRSVEAPGCIWIVTVASCWVHFIVPLGRFEGGLLGSLKAW